ncbi:hypothetical protein Nmel_012213 [Mimus melanotis]
MTSTANTSFESLRAAATTH